MLVDIEGTSTRGSFLKSLGIVMGAIAGQVDIGENSTRESCFESLGAVQETLKKSSLWSSFFGTIDATSTGGSVTSSSVKLLGSIMKNLSEASSPRDMGETSKLEPSFELVGDVEEARPFQIPGHIKEGLTGSIFGIADVSIMELSPAKSLIDTEEVSTEDASLDLLGTIVEVSTGAVSPFEVLGSVVDLSTGAVSSFKGLGQVADAALRESAIPEAPSDIEEPPREISPLAKPPVGLLEEDSESGAGIEDE